MATVDSAPSVPTVIVVSAFCVGYLAYLTYRLYSNAIDLYDYVMLSMIALLPGTFVLWPSLSYLIAELLGVTFPFVIMFSALLLVVFVIVHHVLVRLHRFERITRLLVQEIALRSDASREE